METWDSIWESHEARQHVVGFDSKKAMNLEDRWDLTILEMPDMWNSQLTAENTKLWWPRRKAMIAVGDGDGSRMTADASKCHSWSIALRSFFDITNLSMYYNSLYRAKQYLCPQKGQNGLRRHLFFIRKETKSLNKVRARTFLNMMKLYDHTPWGDNLNNFSNTLEVSTRN